MMEKILEIIKKYSYTIVIVAVAVVLTVLVIGFNACGNGEDASGSSSDKTVSYAELPEFSKSTTEESGLSESRTTGVSACKSKKFI